MSRSTSLRQTIAAAPSLTIFPAWPPARSFYPSPDRRPGPRLPVLLLQSPELPGSGTPSAGALLPAIETRFADPQSPTDLVDRRAGLRLASAIVICSSVNRLFRIGPPGSRREPLAGPTPHVKNGSRSGSRIRVKTQYMRLRCFAPPRVSAGCRRPAQCPLPVSTSRDGIRLSSACWCLNLESNAYAHSPTDHLADTP